MIKSILQDVWKAQGESDYSTAVHLYTISGRGYYNIELTTPPGEGIIFQERDNPVRRVVLDLDSIDVVELMDG